MSERQEIAQERKAAVAEFRKFRALLVEHFGLKPKALAEVSYNLSRHARALSKIYERQCNGYQTWDHREDTEKRERDERNEAIAMREAEALVSKFLPGARIHTDGDPRGYAIKLHFPTGRVYNTMGGYETGYGIPEDAILR